MPAGWVTPCQGGRSGPSVCLPGRWGLQVCFWVSRRDGLADALVQEAGGCADRARPGTAEVCLATPRSAGAGPVAAGTVEERSKRPSSPRGQRYRLQDGLLRGVAPELGTGVKRLRRGWTAHFRPSLGMSVGE